MTQPASRSRSTTPRPGHPKAPAGADPPAGTTPLVAKKGANRHPANQNTARSATGGARREVRVDDRAPVPRPQTKAGAAKACHGWRAVALRLAMPDPGRDQRDQPPSQANPDEGRNHANQKAARSATLVCGAIVLTGSDQANPANSKPRHEPRRVARDGVRWPRGCCCPMGMPTP